MPLQVVYETLAPTLGQTLEFTNDGSRLVLDVRNSDTFFPHVALAIVTWSMINFHPTTHWINGYHYKV